MDSWQRLFMREADDLRFLLQEEFSMQQCTGDCLACVQVTIAQFLADLVEVLMDNGIYVCWHIGQAVEALQAAQVPVTVESIDAWIYEHYEHEYAPALIANMMEQLGWLAVRSWPVATPSFLGAED